LRKSPWLHPVTSIKRIQEESSPLAFTALAVLLIVFPLLPIPYGAVLPGGEMRLELAASVLALLVIFSLPKLAPLRPVRWVLVALGVVIALGIVQLTPFPIDLLRRLSPESIRVYAETNDVLRLFGRRPLAARISIAPRETLRTILLVLAYAALLFSTILLLSNRLKRRWFCGSAILGAMLHAAFAANLGDEPRASGAFVNPNHLAGYLEIGLMIAFGVAWAEILVNRDRVQHAVDAAEAIEKRAIPLAWRILAWGGIAVGIGLTRSRGGIAAAALATAVVTSLGLIHATRRRRLRIAATATLSAAAAITFALVTARKEFLVRFLSSDPREIGTDTRLEIWRASVDAWKHFPIFGSGLGAFREAFRPVQPRDLEGLLEQAHNDFLQILVTGGAVGAIAASVVVGAALVVLFRLWRREQHREESAIILGAFGALLSLTIHGLVEFNFSIPAIPASLACIVGLGIAAGRDE
jgi:putative inorganic carbon (hco3(-)) transporter